MAKKKTEIETPAIPAAPAPVAPPSGLVRVNNTTTKSLGIPPASGFASRDLLPGGNDVDLGHLLAVKDHLGFRWYVQAGWVTLVDSGVGLPEGPEPPATLDGYREAGAVALVQVETNREALRRWSASETREAVVNALAARLAALGA